jgi:lysophospholipase L1-like esterase
MPRFVLAFALLLAACGGGSPKLSRLAPDAVVLAFGDSLTYGTGAQPQESYPAQLEALIGRKVIASGIPGETTAEGLARLDAVLEETKPALVILSHGGNDFLRQLDERQAAENVRAMVRLARARGAQVVLLAVPKPGLVPSPVAFYGDIAKEFGLAYDRDTLTDILTDRELKSDLVHPNAKGYARLAQSVAALLKKSGAV